MALLQRLGVFQPRIKAGLGQAQNFRAFRHGAVGDIAILVSQIEIDIGLGESAGQRQPRRLGIQRGGLGGVTRLGDQGRLLAPEIQMLQLEIGPAPTPNQRQVPA